MAYPLRQITPCKLGIVDLGYIIYYLFCFNSVLLVNWWKIMYFFVKNQALAPKQHFKIFHKIQTPVSSRWFSPITRKGEETFLHLDNYQRSLFFSQCDLWYQELPFSISFICRTTLIRHHSILFCSKIFFFGSFSETDLWPYFVFDMSLVICIFEQYLMK